MNLRPSLEHALREAISDSTRQAAILEATGWDRSMLSKITAGLSGITLDKLDVLLPPTGLVIVGARYLDAIGTLCKVGASCECAMRGMGECGLR